MYVVPIVDISEIGEIPDHVGDNEKWIKVAREIREGLGNIGFIYIKNHGIDRSLVNVYGAVGQTFVIYPFDTFFRSLKLLRKCRSSLLCIKMLN